MEAHSCRVNREETEVMQSLWERSKNKQTKTDRRRSRNTDISYTVTGPGGPTLCLFTLLLAIISNITKNVAITLGV